MFDRKHRRTTMSLNVTALIDIFSIIIIFLVMGTYFGESSIAIPNLLRMPESASKESVESAPRVVISNSDVTANFIPDAMPLTAFRGTEGDIGAFKAKLQAYVKAIPASARKSGVLLNVIADGKTPYRDIFDVIAVFREAGFQSILFVAQGR